MKGLAKKLTAVSAAALSVLMISNTACAEFVYSKILQEIVEVKDSDGNVYEVTHRVERENLTAIDYYENVPMQIYNNTSSDIVGLYVAYSASDEWGDNWLDAIGEGATIPAGEYVYMTFSYDTTDMNIDIRMDTDDGNQYTFEGLDLGALNGSTHCNMFFEYDEQDESYRVTIDV